MKVIRSFVALTVALVAAVAPAFEITEKTLVVLPAKPDARGLHSTFREAAEALVSDVREATGLKLRYVTADKAPDAKGAIWFGEVAAAKAGLVPKGLKGCDCVVAEKGGELYLFGVDKSGRKNDVGASWLSATIPTVRAVTVFEEKFMGVAYLGPGSVGREVPKRAKIEVPAGTFFRSDSFLESGIGRISDLMNSVANANIGGGAWRAHGGHIFPAAFKYRETFKTHPEYFALMGNDRAQGDPNDPAICISNPGARQMLIDEILKEFDEGAEVVELGQNDGYDFCQCEKCRAYGGKVSNGEKFWIFFRGIAEELYRLRPDKTVEITAYGPTYEPPKTFREFPPNVMIEMMRYSPTAFETWKGYRVPRGFAVYIYLWGSYYKPGSTVMSSIPQVADTARLFRENGVRGIYRCGSYELFGTEGPSYYVFAKMLNDPTRDEWKVFDEYCRAAYGPAFEAMRDFHKTLDIRVSGFVKTQEGFPPRPGRIMARPSWLDTPEEILTYIYTPTAMKRLDGILAKAEKTPNLTEKQKTRVALVRLEFDYACHIGRVLWLYNAFRTSPTKAIFEPLADAIEARTKFIESLFDAKGRMKRFPGWKEVDVFGNAEKAELMQNGHLAATLGAPFNWDVAAMRKSGVIPSGAVKKTSAVRVGAKPALGDFDALKSAPENPLGGMQFDKIDFASSFKLAYDDENLYVVVKAELPAHLKFAPQGHDGVCYRQDCFELYVDPTFAHERNFHFIWNPVPDSCLDRAWGLHTDPLDPKFRSFDMAWDGKWAYEVKREGAVWHSLVTIPYASLGAKRPQKGDKWYLNLGRESFPEDKNNITQLSLWSPSMEGGGLEDREAMGIVTFE